MPVGSRVKIGSDTRAFSVLYGIDSLPFSEGKPARLIPRKEGLPEPGVAPKRSGAGIARIWSSVTATFVLPQFRHVGVDQQYPSDFCECPQLSVYKGTIGSAYEISPMYRGSQSAEQQERRRPGYRGLLTNRRATAPAGRSDTAHRSRHSDW